MKKRFKKTAAVMIIIGFIITVLSAYFAYRQYELITQGSLVKGTVINIIADPSAGNEVYKPEIIYRDNDVEKKHIPLFGVSSRTYVVGDPVDLRVKGEQVTIDGFHAGVLGLLVGLVLGLVFLIIGIVWFSRHRTRHDKYSRLKLHGRRVHARYVRQEITNYEMNDQKGVILYLQQEDGERIFQTQPIFSEFSIQWLEEHIFDVYVDTRDPNNYYIDIEKHFGHPTSSA